MSLLPKKTKNIGTYCQAYRDALSNAWATLDLEELAAAEDTLRTAYVNRSIVMVCGNGGSAAISNHLLCDHCKGVATDTELSPSVISLSSNIELITAIANDVSFEEVFVYQAQRYLRPGAVLLTISSSGNSPNIIAVTRWAKSNGVKVIAMTGFSGGVSREIADIKLHINANNYGVIEDIHQSLMHILAQFIRQLHMHEDQIAAAVF